MMAVLVPGLRPTEVLLGDGLHPGYTGGAISTVLAASVSIIGFVVVNSALTIEYPRLPDGGAQPDSSGNLMPSTVCGLCGMCLT